MHPVLFGIISELGAIVNIQLTIGVVGGLISLVCSRSFKKPGFLKKPGFCWAMGLVSSGICSWLRANY
jgi:hypothetical protein